MITTIVSGPPGAGKTTYVKSQMVEGDLILDDDLLYQAISGQVYYNKPIELFNYVRVAREAIISELIDRRDVYRAWIIGCYPKAEDRGGIAELFNAKVVVLKPLEFVCLNRIQKDDRRSKNLKYWVNIVHKWYRDYTPREGDVVMEGGQKVQQHG